MFKFEYKISNSKSYTLHGMLSIWKATSYHRYIHSLSTVTYMEADNLYWLFCSTKMSLAPSHEGGQILNITLYNIRLKDYQSMPEMLNICIFQGSRLINLFVVVFLRHQKVLHLQSQIF